MEETVFIKEEIDIKDPLELPPLEYSSWRNKQGQVVHIDQKLIIIDLYKKLKKNNPAIFKKDAIIQLSKQTGIGINSIKNTLIEYKNRGTVSAPKLTKRRLTFKEKINECDKNAIRRKVHEFYFNNELPTLNKVLQVVNADKNLPNFKRSTFHALLKELNFTHTVQYRNLIEKDDIIIWRRNYLRTIKRYREEGRQIYYLDETWINSDDVRDWMDKTVVSSNESAFLRGLTTESVNPNKKGERLIAALHIGSAAGFVSGGLLYFETKKYIGDHHNEMDGDTFLKWFKNILPLLDDNAVIVMDNASCHSMKLEQVPNATWKKPEIIKWLENKGKEISEDMVKAELLQIVALQKNRFDKYIVDEIANQDNKTILRLPPYHCELNPIKMVWSMIKEYIKSNNKSKDVKLLLEQSIKQVTAEHWSNFIRQVRDKEKKMWEIDYLADKIIDRIPASVINVDEMGLETSDSD